MPLSEEELRLLEQMERALSEEDPKFASTLRGTTMRNAARRNAFVAALGLVVGIAVLMAGVITHYWQIGIGGFVIMLGAATLGLAALRGQRVGPAAFAGETPGRRHHPSGFGVVDGGRRNRRPRGRSAFMDTMRTRWRRRRDLGGW
ncbi:spore wall synthesis complex protein [Nocardioides maradonensis]